MFLLETVFYVCVIPSGNCVNTPRILLHGCNVDKRCLRKHNLAQGHCFIEASSWFFAAWKAVCVSSKNKAKKRYRVRSVCVALPLLSACS